MMTAVAIFVAAAGLAAVAALAVRRTGWVSTLPRALVRRAATHLPASHRERWEEEWQADLAMFSDRPLTAAVLAIRIAWYAPSIGTTLGEDAERTTRRDSVGAATRQESWTPAGRRYQTRRQLGRFLALTPIAGLSAGLGGFLLQTIQAPKFAFYAFAIALGCGTVLQILLRGAGLPRPGAARGAGEAVPSGPGSEHFAAQRS
jgi:hypothetical protein